MPQGIIYSLEMARVAGVVTLVGITSRDFTHDTGAPTTTNVYLDDEALTINDRYKVEICYPSTALPATSLTLAALTATATAAIDTALGAGLGFTAPGAPTIGTATKTGTTTATVAFTVPASNGGSPITVYTAVSTPGGITRTGTSSPINMTGLTTATAYTFRVTATNAIGTSAQSAASNSITTD